MEFVDVATAKNSSGLRGAFVGGAPSPWGEAANGRLRSCSSYLSV